VAIGLLLNSTKYATFMELATGYGKSLMLAILAVFLNKLYKKKVLVLVPSKVLAAYQQFNYCPSAG